MQGTGGASAPAANSGASTAPASGAADGDAAGATPASANALWSLFDSVTSALSAGLSAADASPAEAAGWPVPPRARTPPAAAGAEAPAPEGPSKKEDSAVATLSEIAAIISAVARENLGDLLTHPGAATIGVYYLARRHQLEKLAEPLDGSHVGDSELVHELLRYTDVSDSVYPDRYADIVSRGKIMDEKDILYHSRDASRLMPGFYIARDPHAKKILWVIRGASDINEVLADLAGNATPLPGGGYGHWAMWQAALALMDAHLGRVLDALAAHPAYGLTLVGHSVGAGVAALVAHVLRSNADLAAKLGGASVEAVCIAPAPCMSSDLASASCDFIKTLVMRYDLVPRFSASSVEGLKQELLGVDYKGLLSEDVLGSETVRKAVEATRTAAARLKAQDRARAALSQAQAAAAELAAKVNPKIEALEKLAGDTAACLAERIDTVLAPEEAAPAADGGGAEGAAAGKDGVSLEALRAAAAAKVVAATDTAKGAALQSRGVRDALGWVSATLKRAAAASGSGSGSGAGGAGSAASGAQDDTSSGGPEDERTAAERAAAEGKLLDAPLYAPGRVYWLRPIDESLPEEQHSFELVDTGCDTRFQRIVLRATCVSDHYPRSARAALLDVLARLKNPPPGAAAAAPKT